MKLLLPTDGSPAALRAVNHAVALMPMVRELEAHLLHVQAPVDSWEVKSHMGAAEIAEIQRRKADDALRDARTTLQAVGIPFVTHVEEGDPSEVIVRLADDLGCHQVVMGTRGMGALSGLLMGSVSSKVLQRASMPVTLVK